MSENSIKSITILSILLFFIYTIFEAILTFGQFKLQEILSVSLVFFSLFIFLVIIFYKRFYLTKIVFNLKVVALSLIVTFFMIIFLHASIGQFKYYYHTFPLLETEIGLGWHKDTANHVSIIQSILNFGYPSIGQHGTPVFIYHVLSHYIDALILKITGLEPYDSYGLFFHFKKFLMLSSILVFVSFSFRKEKIYFFIIAYILIAPIIVGTYHIIGSHPLWFTSMVLILSAPKVFNILIKGENDIKDYLFIFFIIIIISLGKISTGFMYASFVGVFLLLKQPYNKFTYILGSSWVLFFLIYKKLMEYNATGKTGIDFSWINLNEIYNYLFHNSSVMNNILASIFIFILLSYIFKNRVNVLFLISSIVTLVILMIITKSMLTFNKNDIFYFIYGFSSVIILFVIQLYAINLTEFKNVFKNSTNIEVKKIVFITILLSSLYIISFLPKPKMNNLNISICKQVNEKFKKINKKLPKKYKLFCEVQLKGIRYTKVSNKINRPLLNFRNNLYTFMKKNQILKKNTVMFIPKNIFTNDFKVFKGTDWARGMLIYAITGVPLVYGVKNLRGNYGYLDYSKNNLWLDESKFSSVKICKDIKTEYIIIVNSLFKPEFSLHRCKNVK